MATMGMVRASSRESERMARVASYPFILGIMMSMRIKSNVPASACSNALSTLKPSSAHVTFAPASVRMNRAISRFRSLSSAKRMFIPASFARSCAWCSFSVDDASKSMVKGKVTVQTVPSPKRLSYTRSPSMSSASCLAMTVPNPVPVTCSASFRCSRENGSNTRFWKSELMPMPVSAMTNLYVAAPPSCACSEQVTRTAPPGLLYFTALLAMFMIKRFRCSELAMTTGWDMPLRSQLMVTPSCAA